MADSEKSSEPPAAQGPESPVKAISPAEDSTSLPSYSIPRRQLLTALAVTDDTIRRLHTLLSTASGQETLLGSIEYTAQSIHHLLASAPWIALQTRLSLLARLRAKRTSSTNAPTNPKPSSSSSSSSPLLALSSLISATRYNLRLFGLLPLWMWGSATIKSPPEDTVIYALTLVQVVVNMAYQLLENVAYLASKGVVSKRFVDRYGGIGKWYLWSTRAWFGHIFFQFFKLWRQSVLMRRKEEESRRLKQAAGEKVEFSAEEIEARRLEVRAWRKSLVNNLIWAPLCVHWSVEKGIGIPGNVTGFFSFLAGAWELHDAWKRTAKS